MIGIDTNVLVRYVIEDDPIQTSLAIQFLDSRTVRDPGYIPLICIAEFCWVLTRSYKRNRTELARTIRWLLGTEGFVVENQELVGEALILYQKSNADFDDCLIARCAHSAGCRSVVTFDLKAARSIGMQILR